MAANSTLQIEVVSKGITESATRLRKLGEEAEKSEGSVKKLTDSINSLMNAQSKAIGTAVSHNNLMFAMSQAMGLVSQASQATANSVTQLTAQMQGLMQAANNANQALERKNRTGGVFTTTIKAMASAASAYITVGLAKAIVKQSDEWVMATAKLKLVTGSQEAAIKTQTELYDLAQRVRAPLEDMTKLYTRMVVPMQKLGKSSAETKEMVEGVSLALQLGGSTAAEMSSVMLQFSQSINAGRLNGAEFNAVAEGAPSILRAIEAELRRTGQWGENTTETLKQMGAEGKISVELMQSALANALPQWRKDFESLPLTVDKSMTTIINAWQRMLGESIPLRTALNEIAKAFMDIGQLVEEYNRVSKDMNELFPESSGKLNGLTTTAKVFGTVLETILVLSANVMFVLRGVGREIGGIAAQMTAFASGDWVAAYETIPNMMKADAEAARKELDAYEKRVIGMTDRVDKKKTQVQEALAAGAAQDYGNEDRRLASRKAVDPFAGAMSVEEIRKKMKSAAKTREDIVKESNENLKEIEKAYGKAIRDEKNPEKKLELEKEYASRKVALAKETARDLASYDKKDSGKTVDKTDHYGNMVKQMAATKAILQLEDEKQEKLTASEKLRAKLEKNDDADFAKLNATQKAKILAMVDENIALEKAKEAKDAAKKADQEAGEERVKYFKKVSDSTDKLKEETDKVNDETAALSLSKTALRELAAARLDDNAAKLEAQAIRALDKNGDIDTYNLLMAEAKATRELADAKRKKGAAEDVKEADDKLNKLLDPKKAFAFGDALALAFGKGGDAIGKMTKALDLYGDRQDDIDKVRKELMQTQDDDARVKKLEQLNKLETKNRLRTFGDMAGAAKGFFKEHTGAYKVLSATEKAFRVMELADTIKNNKEKIMGVYDYVKAKGLEIWAMLTGAATDSATTGTQLANSAAKTGANTMEGVSKAFAQWGVYGFIGAAAILAFMGMSGGGSSGTPQMGAEERQKKQGTGTVLGDDEAKSQSFKNALSTLESTADVGLKYSSAMLAALQSINTNISGMAAFVAQSSGLRGGKSMEQELGVGSSSSALGFNKSTTELTDTGIQFGKGQTIGSMIENLVANSYADTKTTKKKAWGLGGTSTKYKTQLGDLDNRLEDSISQTLASITEGLGAAGEAFGKSGEEVKKQLMGMSVDLDRISLMGLSGDDLEAELNSAFSALGDKMTQFIYGDAMKDFQKLGEGYFETVARVASGTEQAKIALERVGVAAIDYANITNKHGDVATEMARDSIQIKEAGTTLGELFTGMAGGMSDLVENYKSLLDIRDTLRATGMGTDVTRDMIAGAGGIEALTSGLSDYLALVPENERATIQARKLQEQFTRLNVKMPKTNMEFTQMIDSLMLGDAASQRLAGSLLQMAGQFQEVQDAYTSLIDSAKDDLSEAYEKERDQLTETKDKFEEFGKSLRKFTESLTTGSLSTLTLGQKYAELTTRYQNTLSLARSGDADAIAKFESVANEFLTVSREYNASGTSYTADFESVKNDSAYLATVADTQVSVAQQQLDALNTQVSQYIELNKSVLTVADAITALHKAMAAAGMATPVDGSHANGLANVPFDGYRAELHKGEAVLTAAENSALKAGTLGRSDAGMIDELRELRKEIATLRQDQAKQTEQLIVSNYDAQERNAQAVVDGTQEAVSKSTWTDNSTVRMV